MSPAAENDLLELAARAAGMHTGTGGRWGRYRVTETEPRFCVPWNPRRNTSDAFELAGRLNMTLTIGAYSACASAQNRRFEVIEEAVRGRDMLAHARLAIVRCAAQIGEQMPPVTEQQLDSLRVIFPKDTRDE